MSQSPNPNWAKWIYSSIYRHFYNELNATADVFLEGQHKDLDDKTEWFELRVDGPFYTQSSKGQFMVDCEINVLTTIKMASNAYRIQTLTGIVAAAFDYCIPLYQNPKTSTNQFGILRMKSGRNDNIITSIFGQVNNNTEVIQASVESHYRTELEN